MSSLSSSSSFPLLSAGLYHRPICVPGLHALGLKAYSFRKKSKEDWRTWHLMAEEVLCSAYNKKELGNLMKDATSLVILVQGWDSQPVACCNLFFSDGWMEMRNEAVVPWCQRQGIGLLLMECAMAAGKHILQTLLTSRYRAVDSLFAYVDSEDMPKHKPFMLKAGFKEQGCKTWRREYMFARKF